MTPAQDAPRRPPPSAEQVRKLMQLQPLLDAQMASTLLYFTEEELGEIMARHDAEQAAGDTQSDTQNDTQSYKK